MPGLVAIAALSAALCLFAISCAPASAQQRPPCFPIAKLEDGLKEVAHEMPREAGATERGAIILFTSDDTWTLAVLHEDGVACVVADGTSWHALPQRKPQPPSEAP